MRYNLQKNKRFYNIYNDVKDAVYFIEMMPRRLGAG